MKNLDPCGELAHGTAFESYAPAPGALPHTNVAARMLQAVTNEIHPLVPCVPGGNDMRLIEAAYAVGLRPVVMRSELGAGYTANGIAWESNMPVLCIVITAVGVYGLLQALYAAYVNRRPIVVVSGEVAIAGTGSIQAGNGWDGPSVVAVTRPLTVWSFDALTADLAVRGLYRAVLIAREARRPTHLNVPVSVQEQLTP